MRQKPMTAMRLGHLVSMSEDDYEDGSQCSNFIVADIKEMIAEIKRLRKQVRHVKSVLRHAIEKIK